MILIKTLSVKLTLKFKGSNEHDGTAAQQKQHTLADDSKSDFDGFNSDDVTGA